MPTRNTTTTKTSPRPRAFSRYLGYFSQPSPESLQVLICPVISKTHALPFQKVNIQTNNRITWWKLTECLLPSENPFWFFALIFEGTLLAIATTYVTYIVYGVVITGVSLRDAPGVQEEFDAYIYNNATLEVPAFNDCANRTLEGQQICEYGSANDQQVY